MDSPLKWGRPLAFRTTSMTALRKRLLVRVTAIDLGAKFAFGCHFLSWRWYGTVRNPFFVFKRYS
jgi:hypothetical protein